MDLAKKINNAIKKSLKIKDKDDKEPRFTYYRSDGTPDSFDRYINLKEFGNEIAARKISLNEAIKQQTKKLSKVESLENNNVKTENNKIFKKEILKNVRIVYNARLDIIEGFEKEMFLMGPEIKQQQQIQDITEKSQEPKNIPEWVEISYYAFNKVKDKIDKEVNKILAPRVAGNKVNYLHLQSFLKKILNKDLKNSDEAREYYAKNIYEKYERGVRD